MTKEEIAIVERLKRTYDDVEDLRKNFDIVAEVALVREQEIIGLKILCAQAAEALDCHNLDHLQDALIADLRKAAE